MSNEKDKPHTNPELNMAQRMELIMRKQQLGRELDKDDLNAIAQALRQNLGGEVSKKTNAEIGAALEVLALFEEIRTRNNTPSGAVSTIREEAESVIGSGEKPDKQELIERFQEKYEKLPDGAKSLVDAQLPFAEVQQLMG